jgi:hypothetical protein
MLLIHKFHRKQLATNQAKVGDYRVCTKAIWTFISIIALILTCTKITSQNEKINPPARFGVIGCKSRKSYTKYHGN